MEDVDDLLADTSLVAPSLDRVVPPSPVHLIDGVGPDPGPGISVVQQLTTASGQVIGLVRHPQAEGDLVLTLPATASLETPRRSDRPRDGSAGSRHRAGLGSGRGSVRDRLRRATWRVTDDRWVELSLNLRPSRDSTQGDHSPSGSQRRGHCDARQPLTTRRYPLRTATCFELRMWRPISRPHQVRALRTVPR